jgi:hypothetical protein
MLEIDLRGHKSPISETRFLMYTFDFIIIVISLQGTSSHILLAWDVSHFCPCFSGIVWGGVK